jgi:hypothetical protein
VVVAGFFPSRAGQTPAPTNKIIMILAET